MGLIYSESGADEFPHLSKTINSNKFSHEKDANLGHTSRWLATAPLLEEAEGERGGLGGRGLLCCGAELRAGKVTYESPDQPCECHTPRICVLLGDPLPFSSAMSLKVGRGMSNRMEG